MKHPACTLLLAVMIGWGWMGMPGTAATRDADGNVVSLSGTWAFQLDPDDRGVREEWFRRNLPLKIQLPGSLQAQGFGNDVSTSASWTGAIVDRSWFTDPRYEKYRQPGNVKIPFWLTPGKEYVGVAWYRREIKIPPAWRGKQLRLALERAHWETTAWLDDRPLGTCNSLSVPHEYDLGSGVEGIHHLTIRVDNRVKISVGENAHSVSDHTQTNWNGIVGKIELQARDAAWIEDLQVYPDLKNKTARVVVTVRSAWNQPAKGFLTLGAETAIDPSPSNPTRTSHPFDLSTGIATVEATVSLRENAQTWDEFLPTLCRLRAVLSAVREDEQAGDEKVVVFGLREFTTSGTQFRMNGNPTILRGTLECCIFPQTGYPPTDVASWERILTIAKDHGLNHLRFHSWCPPEAAFVAADRLGVLYSIECAAWANVGDGQPVDAWIRAEGDRILKAYGNHPSFCMLMYGNEPSGKNQKAYFAELISAWRSKDSRRLYSSAAGWPSIPENQFDSTPAPRIQAWGQGLSSRVNARLPETTTDYREILARHNVPVVSHEIGQWCVYPNFDETAKYTGFLKARNFEVFRDFLNENHMGDQAHDFLIASGKLQTLLYKEDVEAILRTPGAGGFQLLDLHDFPGQGTALVGVLDAFWDSKGYVTPEEYRRFAGATVPLARLSKRVWTSDETFVAQAEMAHFGPTPIENARPVWILADETGHVVAEGRLPVVTVPLGNGFALGEIKAPLAAVAGARKLVLTLGLEGSSYSNSWDLWVYPPKVNTTIPEGVRIVERLDAEALTALKSGGKVLLLPARGAVRGDRYGKVPAGFSSIFWNTAWTSRQPPHTLGILCDPKHPALAGFPTESHSNWQWWYPIHRSQIMILDGLPPELRPIVQVIDDWFTARRLGLILEASVEGGRLLICGVDLRNDLDEDPVRRQMLASLLDYMNGKDFNPARKVDAAAIQGLFREPGAMVSLGATVARVDSQESGFEGEMAIDDDPATFWHTEYGEKKPGYPHELVIDLGKRIELKGFHYLPRQDGNTNGMIARYALSLSDDGKSWGEPVASGAFTANPSGTRVEFPEPRSARFIRLTAVSSLNGKPYAAIAELEILRP